MLYLFIRYICIAVSRRFHYLQLHIINGLSAPCSFAIYKILIDTMNTSHKCICIVIQHVDTSGPFMKQWWDCKDHRCHNFASVCLCRLKMFQTREFVIVFSSLADIILHQNGIFIASQKNTTRNEETKIDLPRVDWWQNIEIITLLSLLLLCIRNWSWYFHSFICKRIRFEWKYLLEKKLFLIPCMWYSF